MDDTLNKALDLAKQGVLALSDTFKQAAPEVWRIYIKQSYAESAAEAFVALFSALVFYLLIPRIWKLGKEEDEVFYLLGTLSGLVLVAVFMATAVGAILGFINPEYYALKGLLQNLHGN